MLLRLSNVFALTCAMTYGVVALSQTYTGPKALGPYQIGTRLTVKMLLGRLGKPAANVGKRVLCFKLENGDYLWISKMAEERKLVGSILLSDFPNCIASPVNITSAVIRDWKTKEGIGLGSKKEDVLKTYGKPSSDDKITGNKYRWIVDGDYQNDHYTIKHPPDRGEEVLYYDSPDSLFVAAFGLHNGIVTWIYFSEDE